MVVIAADTVLSKPINVAQLLAVPMFVIAAIAADQLAWSWRRSGRDEHKFLLILQSVLLISTLVVAAVARPSLDPHRLWGIVTVMIAVSAMSVQNTLLHVFRKSAPTTAVMTGNLVVATLSLLAVLRDDADSAKELEILKGTWPLLAGFIAGCIAGATSVEALGDIAWIIPVVTSFVPFLLPQAQTQPLPNNF